jgi:hypothetical protein
MKKQLGIIGLVLSTLTVSGSALAEQGPSSSGQEAKVAQDQPDLVVEIVDASFLPYAVVTVEGYHSTVGKRLDALTLKITNRGSASASPSKVQVQIGDHEELSDPVYAVEKDASKFTYLGSANVPSLAPGHIETVTIKKLDENIDARQVTILTKVDPGNRIAEANETNNTDSLFFTGYHYTPEWKTPSSAFDKKVEGAFLWNGSKHHWDYNHRVNRMGDWIRPGNCAGVDAWSGSHWITPARTCTTNVGHTGASGTGPDDLDFESFFSFVSTPSASFRHQSTGDIFLSDGETAAGLRIQNVEGTKDQVVHRMEIETNTPYNTAVLRGYDMVSAKTSDVLLDPVTADFGDGYADLLINFSLGIQNEDYDHTTGVFSYDVVVKGKFDCSTPECKGLNWWAYDVEVMTTVISTDSLASANWVTPTHIENAYTWNKKDELHRSQGLDSHTITGTGEQFEDATVAFKSIKVNLDNDRGEDEAFHMLELDTVLENIDYNPTTGKIDYDSRLLFKGWNEDGSKNYNRACSDTWGSDAKAWSENWLEDSFGTIDDIVDWIILFRPVAGLWDLVGMAVNPADLAKKPIICSSGAVTVKKNKGQAHFTAEVQMLQFAEADVQTDSVEGGIHWAGWGKFAFSPDSESTISVTAYE